MKTDVTNRYDFALVFDVQDGNPNGDPDAGNLPRVDPETGHGIVTDVCLKRKVRNFVQLVKKCRPPHDIYVKEKAVLGRAQFEAFKKLGIETGEEARKRVPSELAEMFSQVALPEGLFFDGDGEEPGVLVVAPDADKKTIKDWLKEEKPDKKIDTFIKEALREAKPKKPTADDTEKGRVQMCADFYDIRTFGAVMSLKSAPNCGQVRGPVQLTFGRSVDPVVALEHSITRMAVATEAEAEKQQGDNRTMGRKHTIPYGLYVAHGFVSPFLAGQTGFCQEDLNLLWEALCNMFEHDRSAARGLMSTQRLIVFKHESALGNAPAHALFKRVRLSRKEASRPARGFEDYRLEIDRKELPEGISIIEKP
jgi:CRISPR-associated protein Csd2